MKLIALTKGYYAIVDDDDFDRLNKFNWHSLKGHCHDKYYAARMSPRNHYKRHTILMHREIIDVPDGMEVDHINGNSLDNRKKNLRICTKQENRLNKKSKFNAYSKYVGVCRDNTKKRFRVKVKGFHPGVRFESDKCAALFRDILALREYGEFANLNFPEFEEFYGKFLNHKDKL